MRMSDWSSDVCSSDLSGRADRAIVLRGGSQAEINSSITRDNMLTILDAAGVRKDASGKPIGCGELVTVVNLPKIDDGNSRSDERRVGKECVSTCRSRWSPDH